MTSNDSLARLEAEESAILEGTEALWGAMLDRGKTRSSIASALGVQRGTIARSMSGNLTLRTLGRIAHVLGYDVQIRLVPRGGRR